MVLLVEGNLVMRKWYSEVWRIINVANRGMHLRDSAMALDYLFRRGPYADTEQYSFPCVTLYDLPLPEIHGLEGMKTIKASEELQGLPVVILFTSEAERDIVQTYEYHANSYLVKPVDLQKFTDMMRDFVFYWLSWNRQPWA